MAERQLEADEIRDQDDLPILADADEPAPQEQSILADLGDHEQHLRALLSDEELAALSDDDDEGEDEDEGAEEPEPEPEPEQPAAEQQKEQTPAAAEAPIQLSEEAIAKIDADFAAAQKVALDEWRDGMLTDEELEGKLTDARKAAREAERAAADEILDRQAEEAWQRRVTEFQSVAATYLDQHPHLKGEDEIRAYDAHIRQITGSGAYNGLTDMQKLELAHKRYLADAEALGLAMPAKAEKPAPAPAPERDKTLRQVVPSLARAPAAATNSAADGKWGSIAAALERADPIQAEEILGRLTPEEREAFASMDV